MCVGVVLLACMTDYAPLTCLASCRGQKRVSYSLEWKVQMIVRYDVDFGSWTQVLWKSATELIPTEVTTEPSPQTLIRVLNSFAADPYPISFLSCSRSRHLTSLLHSGTHLRFQINPWPLVFFWEMSVQAHCPVLSQVVFAFPLHSVQSLYSLKAETNPCLIIYYVQIFSPSMWVILHCKKQNCLKMRHSQELGSLHCCLQYSVTVTNSPQVRLARVRSSGIVSWHTTYSGEYGSVCTSASR